MLCKFFCLNGNVDNDQAIDNKFAPAKMAHAKINVSVALKFYKKPKTNVSVALKFYKKLQNQ